MSNHLLTDGKHERKIFLFLFGPRVPKHGVEIFRRGAARIMQVLANLRPLTFFRTGAKYKHHRLTTNTITTK